MHRDIEVGLTDQERDIRDVAHTFAKEVMRPAGIELDRLADPQDVIAPNSILWEVFHKWRGTGLGDLQQETASLSPLEQARVQTLVYEELGWGDSGLAISLAAGGFHKIFSVMSGRQALIDRWCRPDATEVGCWAITEPDHGSDTLTFSEPHFSDPSVRPNCVARRDGDDYVINGQKSGWVSNGTIAQAAALFCTIDPSQGFSGGGVAVLPLDLPGVSRGKPTNKLGQRALNQGEIFFDEVRIPAEYMVVGCESYRPTLDAILTMANAIMGATFVGVARAAYEAALDYAHGRVQGGRPIIEHQSVRTRLFRMFARVEAARALSRRVSYHNATDTPLLQYSIASKTFCTDVAFETTNAALQIFGGNGLTKDFPVEKLLRDARAAQIEDGCNEVLELVGATRL